MIENKLPKSWVWNQIVDLLAENPNGKLFQQGWSPQCHNHPAPNDHWGVLKTTAIQDGEFWEHENKELPESLEPRPHIEVCEGDILMTCAGPRNRCGVVCFVKKTRQKLLMSGKMYRFRTNSQLLDSKYLEGFIRSHHAQHAIDTMKTGISDSGLNLTHGRFAELMIPLAPLNEQKRIVAKIEELFSELDSGIAALKTAREQLKVYRQAVLKHAFEGKLTAKWREKNADKLESPEQLLARIQQEREARYQEQLEDWMAAVKEWEANSEKLKKPKKPKNVISAKILTKSEVQEFCSLPKGWALLNLGSFINRVDAGKSFKCDEREPNQNEIGVAKVSAVSWGEYNESESKTCIDLEKINPDYFINSGDFIFSRANTIELVGSCVIARKVNKNIMLSDKTLRLKFNNINKEYVLQYLRSHYGRNEIMKRSTGNQESMRNIGQDKIKSIVLPVCSTNEMEKVVKIVNEILEPAIALSNEIEMQLLRAKALRQSILKKAFSGQLVPQDPSDEPASKLLARIQAEKEFVNTQKTSKSNKRHSVSSH